jgi:tRNA-binding protein
VAPIVAEVIKPKIKYEDFAKIELKVAKVISAERKEGSEKLLRLKISLGGEERTILAGIAKAYEPEALVGKELVVVANLEPRKMMGEESNGMLLAATGSEGIPIVLRPEREAGEGASIK